ncbi:MAG: FAD-dependent oxidoreductase [Methylotenera sp.]|nr:FAD-dependent oxidoreductase [Oligoflexia bacterium]
MKGATVVLVAGGHTHALVLKEFQRRGLVLSDLIVISDSEKSPYSGLLTGQIAGIYADPEIYIEVERLTRSVQGRFIKDAVRGIDFKTRDIETERHGKIHFDLLSLNCGARPDRSSIQGSSAYAHAVKPTQAFQQEFNDFLTKASERVPVRIIQIGGGVAGVECSAGFRRRLDDLGISADITLMESGPVLLPSHNRRVRRAVLQMLSSLRITVRTGEAVHEVREGQLLTEREAIFPFDFAVQATPAQPQEWVRNLELAHCGNFIQIDDFLKTSHPNVFAVGDVAKNPHWSIPRAGVYAVREAPILCHNILATLSGSPLKSYRPQKRYLNLIMDGHGRAIASRGWFYFPRSRLMWWLKDRIDRGFVRKLNTL